MPVSSPTQASYDDAAAKCRAKVDKIVHECRRINRKYRDRRFDLEADLKLGRRDCLESLWSVTIKGAKQPGHDLKPRSAKRVVDVFDDPQLYIDGPTANDVRQGRDGDCWLMAALCTLSNKEGLIERLCVAHDPGVGVYGFVFYRDGEWISEIVDDFVRALVLKQNARVLTNLPATSFISPKQTTTKATWNVCFSTSWNGSIPKRLTERSTNPTAGRCTLRNASTHRRLGCRCWRRPMRKHTEIMPPSKGGSAAKGSRTSLEESPQSCLLQTSWTRSEKLTAVLSCFLG